MAIYAADFEATTAAFNPNETSVWAGTFMPICQWDNDNAVKKLESIYEFVWLLENGFKNKDLIYFHNLKYDGSFILNELLEGGYEEVSNVNEKVRNEDGKIVPRYSGRVFDTMISDLGVWYRIRVKTGRYKAIEIRNSLCLVNSSLAKMGASFKTRKQKLDIDYDEASVPHALTDEEWEYMKADCQILAEVLDFLVNKHGMTKMTAGANAFAEFVEMYGGKKKFETIFPELLKAIDKYCRESYKGGISWVNPDYIRKTHGKGITVDKVSMYPSQQHSQSGNLYPYGEPVFWKAERATDRPPVSEDYPLWIGRVMIAAKIKSKHMPCIQIKHSMSFRENEWLTEVGAKVEIEGTDEYYLEPIELTITSADWELIQECYDIDDEFCFLDAYMFHGNMGFFDKYIDKWIKIKSESSGALKALAKLMLNSLYGKFGTRPEGVSKSARLEDDVLKLRDRTHMVEEDGEMVEKKLVEDRNSVYVPVACFTTAYARMDLVRAVNANYDRVCYTDTDSMHLLDWDDPVGIRLGKTLGCWNVESKWSRGKFLRQKTYVEDIVWPESEAGLNIKCAGMPEKMKYGKYIGDDGLVHKFPKITFDEFEIGARWETGKLLAKQVKGGVVLVDTPFEIKSPAA